MPCGHLPMLDRVMPCTRQVLVTHPRGDGWEILDRVGDTNLRRDLLSLEQEREQLTRHRVTLTVVDREANSLELSQKYAESDHFALLTLLDDPVSAELRVGTPAFADVFRLTDRWRPLATEPNHSRASARWASGRAAGDDPRVFWLMRADSSSTLRAVYALSQPVADCASDVRTRLRGSGARTEYRRRWPATENVIREMVGGGHLNENYGYTCHPVPNRLRQHQYEAANAQVTATANQIATTERQLETLTARYTAPDQSSAQQLAELARAHAEREAESCARRQTDQTTRRVEQQLAHVACDAHTRHARRAQRTAKFKSQTRELAARQTQLETKLAERQATRAAIDLTHV